MHGSRIFCQRGGGGGVVYARRPEYRNRTWGTKVGRSKPPPVLTSCFNRLKPPWSICQKVVNTGQYESEWSIENSKGLFSSELRYLYRFYVLSIAKRKKNWVVPAKGTLYGEIFISRP